VTVRSNNETNLIEDTKMSVLMTKDEREQFLADLHVGVLGVSAHSRAPIVVPVWYTYEPGGEVRFVTFERAKKVEFLRREKRITLCVQTETSPYKYVSVEGPIVGMDLADVERDVRPIAHRYLGKAEGDAYIRETSGEVELLVRMKPERWSSADYSKEED
jgi:hypothetical protein